MLVDPLILQHVRHLYLCGDGRMVGTRLPQGLIPLHSLETDQDILHGIVQGVAHVQLTRHVWRRHDNGKRFLVRIYLRVKIAFIQPLLIQPVLQPFGVVSLCQLFFH